ncbi:MAG: hypothetical protein WD070_05165 [Pirellulaceae bacterium]
MIQLLIESLGRLAAIPGLGFLNSYQQQLMIKLGRINQQIGDYQTQRNDAVNALKHAKDLPKNVKGAKKRG